MPAPEAPQPRAQLPPVHVAQPGFAALKRWRAPRGRVARVGVGALALLLLLPTALAWEARFVSAPAEASLTESLLLAGAVNATAPEGGYFGAPFADRLLFDQPVSIQYCPDRAGEPQMDAQCPQAEALTGARVYVLAGGLVAQSPTGAIELTTRATAAALGGPNVTLNEFAVGAALYVGGQTVVKATGGALVVRPLLSEASIELRGDQGFRTYNGTAYTLLVSGFDESTLEARGAFVAAPALDVHLARAGTRSAETDLRVDDLYDTLRALQPPERADRRTTVTGAFGFFQIVPALLDGAAAARTNLTLNDAPRDDFTFVRLEDGRFSHEDGNWTGSGNATYMLDGEVLVPRPGAGVRFPILIPIALIGLAVLARAFTPRSAPRRSRRYLAASIRVGGLLALCFLVGSTLAPLLGFSPLVDAASLTLRSRVQLALLVVGMVASAYAAIGFPAESLARSVFAWREQPRATLVPAAVGLAATLIFILLATPILLSFVARFVRL